MMRRRSPRRPPREARRRSRHTAPPAERLRAARDELIVHVLEADAAGDTARADRLARRARALDAELVATIAKGGA
jgi:hypothetical protein